VLIASIADKSEVSVVVEFSELSAVESEAAVSDAFVEFSAVSLEVLVVAGGANLSVLSNKGTILTLILYLVIPLPGKVALLKVRKYSVKSSGFTYINNANGSL